MSTISDGTTTYTPTTIIEYQADQASGNVLHDIIGTSSRAVTLRPAGLRTGQLKAVMPTFALASALVAMLTAAKKFTLADSGFTSIGMTFVVDGTISLQPTESFVAWLVVFDFQEVS